MNFYVYLVVAVCRMGQVGSGGLEARGCQQHGEL